MKRILVFTTLWLLQGVFILGATPAYAARTLHVVVAGDPLASNVGKHVESDVANIEQLFGGNVSPKDLNLQLLNQFDEDTGKRKSPSRAQVLKTLQDLPVDNDDAVVFYFSGHGAWLNDGEHYLMLKQEREQLARKQVLATIQAKRPGLIVIMTDACYNYLDVKPGEAFPSYAAALPVTRPLFHRLFFQTNGLIDLNSAKKGQQAGTFLDPERGALFTGIFTEYMSRNSSLKTIGWTDLFREVGKELGKEFASQHPEGVSVEDDQGDYFNQTTQEIGRLIFKISLRNAPFPNPLGDADPETEDLPPSEFVEFEVEIDPATGAAELLKITTTIEADGSASSSTSLEERGQAQLVYLYDVRDNQEHPYYRYRNGGYWEMVAATGKPARKPLQSLKSTRLGITVRQHDGPGVLITAVDPGGPATRCTDEDGKRWSLTVGDYVTLVNFESTTRVADFSAAVRYAQTSTTLRVEDASGQTWRLNVELNDMGAASNPVTPPGNRKTRFGVFVKSAPGGGVIVTGVVPQSPATRVEDSNGQTFRLDPGDLITRINDQAIENEAEFRDAILASPRSMSLQVRSVTDNDYYEFTAKLNN